MSGSGKVMLRFSICFVQMEKRSESSARLRSPGRERSMDGLAFVPSHQGSMASVSCSGSLTELNAAKPDRDVLDDE